MKTITILSGKGGVGKSSITASLALRLSKKRQIVVADCDVDASNLAIILGIQKFDEEKEISTSLKAFTNAKAKNCESIIDMCAFSAISWNKQNQIPEINKFLCEGCGACKLLCPAGIELKKVKNAKIFESNTKYEFPIVAGQLKMGESGSGKIVDEVKNQAYKKNKEILLIDSAAGIGCPVIASVQNSDFVVAVTEPNPSAFSDLKRALMIVNHFQIPYGILINKFNLNEEFSKKIEDFAKKQNTNILGKLPYDKKFIESLVHLKPLVEYDKDYKKPFDKILNKILKQVENGQI